MKGRIIDTMIATIAVAVSVSACAQSAPEAESNDAGGGAGDCALPTSEQTVSLGINPGTQQLVTDVIKAQGLDIKYKLKLDVKSFQNPPASAQAASQKAVNIAYGGLTTMAVARDKGSDMVFFGPFITTPKDGVFVKKDSPITSLDQLKGKKIGSFSGTTSATAAILSAVAAKSYGIPNLGSAAHIVVAPDPALFGLLDKGDIDAALVVDSSTVKADLTGQYRKILDLSDAYEKAFGENPIFVGLVTSDEWAKDHCGELKAYTHAQQDAVAYILSHDDAWDTYAKSLGITQSGASAALKDLSSEFETKWTDSEVSAANDLLESMIPILGEKAYLAKVPDGLFTTKYWDAQ
jgi:NitT/TauT family transport system substrate-binding protein